MVKHLQGEFDAEAEAFLACAEAEKQIRTRDVQSALISGSHDYDAPGVSGSTG